MNMFTFHFPLICCTMSLPVICGWDSVVKRVSKYNLGVKMQRNNINML